MVMGQKRAKIECPFLAQRSHKNELVKCPVSYQSEHKTGGYS